MRLVLLGVLSCLAKCVDGGCNNVFMVHVDDLLFCGNRSFWTEKFLPAMSKKFSVSFNVMGKTGGPISFLKRRMVKFDDGMMVVPGTTAEKVVTCMRKRLVLQRFRKSLATQESRTKIPPQA